MSKSVGRSVGPQYILLLTLFSYTPLRYVRNVAREEQKFVTRAVVDESNLRRGQSPGGLRWLDVAGGLVREVR